MDDIYKLRIRIVKTETSRLVFIVQTGRIKSSYPPETMHVFTGISSDVSAQTVSNQMHVGHFSVETRL